MEPNPRGSPSRVFSRPRRAAFRLSKATDFRPKTCGADSMNFAHRAGVNKINSLGEAYFSLEMKTAFSNAMVAKSGKRWFERGVGNAQVSPRICAFPVELGRSKNWMQMSVAKLTGFALMFVMITKN